MNRELTKPLIFIIDGHAGNFRGLVCLLFGNIHSYTPSFTEAVVVLGGLRWIIVRHVFGGSLHWAGW